LELVTCNLELTPMALYHKHRPQTFDSVVGQEHIIKTITNQILSDKVSHAYLFCGPRGVGKTTTARLLAKAMNCKERQLNSFEPCDACESCLEISKSRAIDVIEIDAASNTGVDNVRTNIIDNAQFQPTKSTYKIFIIDEVHMLSTSAFNALLKIMEEPPKHVMFILATTELHKLPETIISRCQRFDFKRLSYEQMKHHLEAVAKEEGVKLDKEVVDRLVRKSDGCARDGVSLLDQLMATGEKHITPEVASVILPVSHIEHNVSFITALIDKQPETAIQILNTIVDQDADLVHFTIETVEVLRSMMITKVASHSQAIPQDVSSEVKKDLDRLTKQIDHLSLVQLIDLLLKRKTEIRTAPLPQLPLEMVVVEWCFDKQQGTMNSEQRTVSSEHDNSKKSYSKETSPDTKPNTESQKADSVPQKSKETLAPDRSRVEEIADPNIDVEENLQKNNTAIQQYNSRDLTEAEKIGTQEVPPTQTEPTIPNSPPLTLEEAMLKWNSVITAVEQTSPSLVFILKDAELFGVENNVLQLGVQFSFHQDKLMNNKTRFELEERLSTIYERPMKLDVMVKEAAPTSAPSGDLEDLAAALGGEVVG